MQPDNDKRNERLALKKEQRQLELCLTAANLGIWTYNIATDEFWASDRAKHLHGHEPHEVHTFAETGANIHPEDSDRAQAAIAEAIQTHSKLHLEYRVVWQDGSIHWIASEAEFMPSSEQGEGIFYGSVQDISERKRAEEAVRESEARQAFLLRMSDALRSLADPVEIQETVTRTAMNYFGADRCYYCEIEDGIAIIRRDATREDLPTVAGVYPLSRFAILQAVVDAGRPFVVQDVHTTDTVDEDLRQMCIQLQVIAYINVPVIKNGKPVGVLCLVQGTPRDWTHLEVELAVETAERTWASVERARAEAGLRESEEKYRSLFTTMDQGFCIIEKVETLEGQPSDFRYLTANPAFERHTGIHDVVGKTSRDFVPNVEQHIMDIYDDVVRTGQPQQVEFYISDLDRWIEADVFPAQVPGQIAVLFSNVPDRKQAERVLRESEERQAFLLKLSDTLRAQPSADAIASTALGLLAEHLHLDRAYVASMYPAEDRGIVGPEYRRPDLNPMSGVYRLSDFPETLRQGGEGTFWFNNIADDPNLSDLDRQSIAAIDITALIMCGLRKGEKNLIWALVAASSKPRQWTPAEIALVEETAERTWAAMERARAEAALREAELQQMREQSAREQERQRAETLAELDRAKTLFFTHVSHEFRTPLTLSLAPLQDALSDRVNPLTPPHRERVELAHRNAIRLLKLVNTLLDFSRIEAGRMEAVYEPTDLALFTTELASVFRSAIERAGLRLIVDCPPLPEPVYVDREMWEKIVLNLLSNAFKFTLEGEIAVMLHPTDDHHVMLQVQDTGTGIPPEELPRVFERFYQVRRTNARTYEGSGIGLALVHELIRLQGGTVDVSSTLGQGTCFTIAIPLGKAHLPIDRLRRVVGDRITATRTLASTAIGAAPYVEEAERWLPEEGNREQGTGNREELSTPPDSDPPQPPLKRGENSVKVPLFKGDLGGSPGLETLPTPSPAHILLVDDNADMREYLTRILSEHVQVEAVADGASALAAAQERVPDLVLTDVMMPGLDGFELLKALRANPSTREIPIILLSARAGEESVVEGLEAGADDYLIKPFSAQELVSRVKGHLQMAQLRLEALHQERTLNHRKDELLSTVSHELNTPLVAILGWTRLLRANPPNQAMLVKALETIERNATIQAKLVQDLLDISRITAGKLRLSLEPVELESVIENAIASISHLAQAKEIDLVWWGVTGQQSNPLASGNVDPVLVQGDRDRLQQIITNLLTNAIKFTPKQGSINVELSVIERHNGSDASIAEISITDTGIGISAEFLPHVFDRFRQAQESSSSKGLGLGLAIARHLVELHGGRIRAESAGEGQGATFVVRLPLIQQ
jgi:PAS domain S-box-containing protein